MSITELADQAEAKPEKVKPAGTFGVSKEQYWDIEQFLYAEAEMFNERRHEEWGELLADDIHYYMPVRRFVYENMLRAGHVAANEGAHFDENKHRMDMRLAKLKTGLDIIERPYSLLRHLITNIRVQPGDRQGEYNVRSNFHITRTRNHELRDTFVGERQDVLRKADNSYGFEIAKRVIYLDETVLFGGGIGFFF